MAKKKKNEPPKVQKGSLKQTPKIKADQTKLVRNASIRRETLVEDLIRQRTELSNRIDNHPQRFYRYIVNDKEFIMDIKAIEAKIAMTMSKNGAEEMAILEAQCLREEVFTPLLKQKAELTMMINGGKFKSNYGAIEGILNSESETLYDLASQGYSTPQICEILKQKGIEIAAKNVDEWLKKNETAVNIKKTQYLLESGKENIRVASEAGRLTVLNNLLAMWELKINEIREKDSPDLKEMAEATKMITLILKSAREEVKGTLVTVNGKIGIEIDVKASLAANDIVKQILQTLPIHSIIIGNVAAQRRINPSEIIAALSHSIYAKNSGFNGFVSGDEEVCLPSDVIKSYDWNAISLSNSETIEPISIETITEENDPKKREAAQSLRETLLENIKNFNKK